MSLRKKAKDMQKYFHQLTEPDMQRLLEKNHMDQDHRMYVYRFRTENMLPNLCELPTDTKRAAYRLPRNVRVEWEAVISYRASVFYQGIFMDWTLHHQNFIGTSRRWQKFTLPQVPASGRENTAWTKRERFGKHLDRSFRFPL